MKATKPYHLSFKILGLPSTTNSGGRSHWAIKAKEAKRWKFSVYLALRSQLPKAPLQRASLTLTRHSSGKLDYDGLVSSFKHILDGLIDSQVIANDKMENIGIPIYRHIKSPPGRGFIEVTVEEKV